MMKCMIGIVLNLMRAELKRMEVYLHTKGRRIVPGGLIGREAARSYNVISYLDRLCDSEKNPGLPR